MRRITGAVVLVLVLAACGSSGVPPEKWARDVCLVIKPWASQIDAAVTASRAEMTSASKPAQTKAQLVAVFTEAERASAEAVRKVRAAGMPDADNGEEWARNLAQSLEAAERTFGRAAAGVKKLPTDDRAAFDRAMVQIGDQISKDNNAASAQRNNVRSSALEQAFVDVPECG